MIPVTAVDVTDAESLVIEVLRSGKLAQGALVRQLEEGFAEGTGTRHAVAVNNGTTALVAALQALGIGPGDEVITSPFTFIATLNAILSTGATARFADLDAEHLTVDPDGVAAAITPRTAALLPVHLYGQPADMDALTALAADHGLHLVEDAAQAFGATYRGAPVGSFGLGCFSLYATKNITTGEGGMITTDDGGLADRLRLLRNHGMRAHYSYAIPGHNYRMSELHAALGIPQLARREELVAARRHNAAALSKGLAGTPGLILPGDAPGCEHAWHQYTVRLTGDATLTRDGLARALAERGVETGIHYPRLVFDHDCYRTHPRVAGTSLDDVPVAAAAARQVLSLPVHHALTGEQVRVIVTAVREALGA
ncbi:DegT/DnrJ/EryC1/StrS family aminotransferase [Haloechinothrix sp. LS1_15]|uniref:DegT/DnrJ/EryC1/StrS family aminotransferase n=1 Tax=Haloechinothrix sp. LS1_15 TaxID=2652248 RepID=UPI0029480F77|nr:DegT/DnrJ/EryC1/StrS family aminotransferase [Haloechinothrix sp. LS1_15]MDV6012366.1 DegT/DnrJ/EryC1/StrS family aminotransferase [Haloechinothrix sp. LS1_15]